MKKARRIVNKLLETEEVPDPSAYLLQTHEPTELLRGILRDELVEKGWRHIHVRKEDDGSWVVEGAMIDTPHRTYWFNAGARVAPVPNESPDLRMKVMRLFKAAARRAGIEVSDAAIEDISPAYHDGFDLYSEFDDFEEDPGDWNVAIRFNWKPAQKFWSKASQALGYEEQPYQKAAAAAAAAPKPKRSTATDEPTEIQRRIQAIRARHGGKDPEPESLEHQARWRDEIIKPHEK